MISLRHLGFTLEEIAARLRSAEEVSVEEFIRTIEVISMSERLEKYYTPEQLEELEQRRRMLGEERMRQAEAGGVHLQGDDGFFEAGVRHPLRIFPFVG